MVIRCVLVCAGGRCEKVFTLPVEPAESSFVPDSLWLCLCVCGVFGWSGPSFSRLLWLRLAAPDQSAVAASWGRASRFPVFPVLTGPLSFRGVVWPCCRWFVGNEFRSLSQALLLSHT